MALNSQGVSGTLIATIVPTPTLRAVIGSVYVSGGGGTVSLGSSDGTLAITGSGGSYNLTLAQQSATTGQTLVWNGTRWAPAANTAAPQVFAGSGAPTITPTTSAALFYDTGTTNIYEWLAATSTWVIATSSSGGAQFLYQLRDVLIQESGGSFGNNLLAPPTLRIVGYTDSTLQINGTLAVAVGNRLASQNTDQTRTLTVTGVSVAAGIQTISFAGGVFSNWVVSGALVQAIYVYTPVALAAGRVLQWNGTAWVDALVVNSLNAMGQTALGGAVVLAAGQNVSLTQTGQVITIASTASGGGFSSVASRWTTANATSKNAQTAPGNINNDGITIALTASSNPGTLTAWTVTLNGTALANTYTASGAFPSYSVVVPVADLIGNAIETAATVTVALSNSMFNLTANNLTNVQPIAFTTALSGSYVETSLPYYTNSATLNYSYTNQAQITSFGGTFTPTQTPLLPRNATSPSGQFTNIDSRGCTISGTAIGNGLNGAATGVSISLTGSVPAVPSYTPAFFAQTSSSTVPTFTTGSSQTPNAAAGSTITYPVATATTQYNWVATTLPLPRVDLVTPLGVTQLVPDVTSTQSISGTTFNVFGWTSLVVNQASQIFITAS